MAFTAAFNELGLKSDFGGVSVKHFEQFFLFLCLSFYVGGGFEAGFFMNKK